MDPFTGLGSTAVACARLGVNFIGADIDEVYLKEAAARMRDAGEPRPARALPERPRMARAELKKERLRSKR
jgi:DNA modification methylase